MRHEDITIIEDRYETIKAELSHVKKKYSAVKDDNRKLTTKLRSATRATSEDPAVLQVRAGGSDVVQYAQSLARENDRLVKRNRSLELQLAKTSRPSSRRRPRPQERQKSSKSMTIVPVDRNPIHPGILHTKPEEIQGAGCCTEKEHSVVSAEGTEKGHSVDHPSGTNPAPHLIEQLQRHLEHLEMNLERVRVLQDSPDCFLESGIKQQKTSRRNVQTQVEETPTDPRMEPQLQSCFKKTNAEHETKVRLLERQIHASEAAQEHMKEQLVHYRMENLRLLECVETMTWSQEEPEVSKKEEPQQETLDVVDHQQLKLVEMLQSKYEQVQAQWHETLSKNESLEQRLQVLRQERDIMEEQLNIVLGHETSMSAEVLTKVLEQQQHPPPPLEENEPEREWYVKYQQLLEDYQPLVCDLKRARAEVTQAREAQVQLQGEIQRASKVSRDEIAALTEQRQEMEAKALAYAQELTETTGKEENNLDDYSPMTLDIGIPEGTLDLAKLDLSWFEDDVETFVMCDFFEFESQMSSSGFGRHPEYHFDMSFDFHRDEAFMRYYLEQEGFQLELYQVLPGHSKCLATGLVPGKSVLTLKSGTYFKWRCALTNATGQVVGELEFHASISTSADSINLP